MNLEVRYNFENIVKNKFHFTRLDNNISGVKYYINLYN